MIEIVNQDFILFTIFEASTVVCNACFACLVWGFASVLLFVSKWYFHYVGCLEFYFQAALHSIHYRFLFFFVKGNKLLSCFLFSFPHNIGSCILLA